MAAKAVILRVQRVHRHLSPPPSYTVREPAADSIAVKMVASAGAAEEEVQGGTFFDLGRPIVGGWTSHGPLGLSYDPIRGIELMWGAEYGQEGAVYAEHSRGRGPATSADTLTPLAH